MKKSSSSSSSISAAGAADKGKALLIVLVAVASLVLLGFIASSIKHDDKKPTEDTATTSTPKDKSPKVDEE